jgi:murein DD-endopeptidase MepM/ murein hydrolase activator NlpD
MYINIPERWWIYISMTCGMVAMVVLGGAIYFIMLQEETPNSLASTTVTPITPTVIAELPSILVETPPLRTQMGVDTPIRVRVQDNAAGVGLRKVTIYVFGDLMWEPTVLLYQMTVVTTFPWVPNLPGVTPFQIRAETVDGRVQTQDFSVVVDQPAGSGSVSQNGVEGIEVTLQALNDPFDIAARFGVCPGELIQYNPGLATVAPGNEIFIPRLALIDTVGRTCEDPPPNFFQHPQIGRRIVKFAKVFPIDPGFGISRGFGCATFFTGVSPTRVAGASCPTDEPWFHTGLDVGAPEGTPVAAIADGVVQVAGVDRASSEEKADCSRMQGSRPPHIGYGNVIIIKAKFGTYTFVYGHLSEIYVEEGQEVKTNQVIGAVGSTGCSSAPHLHFETRNYSRGDFLRGGSYRWEDPETYLQTQN